MQMEALMTHFRARPRTNRSVQTKAVRNSSEGELGKWKYGLEELTVIWVCWGLNVELSRPRLKLAALKRVPHLRINFPSRGKCGRRAWERPTRRGRRRGRSARWRRCIKLFELSFVPLTLLLLVKVKKTAAYECAVSFRLKLLWWSQQKAPKKSYDARVGSPLRNFRFGYIKVSTLAWKIFESLYM